MYLQKSGFDTDKNEPLKMLKCFSFIHSPPYKRQERLQLMALILAFSLYLGGVALCAGGSRRRRRARTSRRSSPRRGTSSSSRTRWSPRQRQKERDEPKSTGSRTGLPKFGKTCLNWLHLAKFWQRFIKVVGWSRIFQ